MHQSEFRWIFLFPYLSCSWSFWSVVSLTKWNSGVQIRWNPRTRFSSEFSKSFLITATVYFLIPRELPFPKASIYPILISTSISNVNALRFFPSLWFIPIVESHPFWWYVPLMPQTLAVPISQYLYHWHSCPLPFSCFLKSKICILICFNVRHYNGVGPWPGGLGCQKTFPWVIFSSAVPTMTSLCVREE